MKITEKTIFDEMSAWIKQQQDEWYKQKELEGTQELVKNCIRDGMLKRKQVIMSEKTFNRIFMSLTPEQQSRVETEPNPIEYMCECQIDNIIDRLDLRQINDRDTIAAYVKTALDSSPKLVTEYRNGKEKAFNSLFGQIIKASKGKVNPEITREILTQQLSSNT